MNLPGDRTAYYTTRSQTHTNSPSSTTMDPNMPYTYIPEASPTYTSPPSWPTSAAMTRGSSHGSGRSEYSHRSSLTSNSSHSQFGTASSPDSDYHPGNSVVDSQDSTQDDQQDWYQYYDFITVGDAGQGPFWKLKGEYTPSAEYPAIINVEPNASDPGSASESPGFHVCLTPYCAASPFRRKSDLQRHYRHRHQAVEQKEAFYCDWKRCQRHREPFFRLDHCRDHHREFHADDMRRRGAHHHKEDREWWASRYVDARWWRCARCLARVAVEDHGFECPRCKTACEPERRRIRGYE